MPITYTNRKGITYILCQGQTKTGKPRYTFSREPQGPPLAELPAGYEIRESVNGLVSLAKSRPALIRPQEKSAVEAVLQRHPKRHNYRVGVKQNRIEIYERVGPDIDEVLSVFRQEGFDIDPDRLSAFREHSEQAGQFSPVMRFILADAEKRTFRAQRMGYLSSNAGWIFVGETGPITRLAKDLVPALGTDAFFELP